MIRLSSKTFSTCAAAVIAALALAGCGEEKTSAAEQKALIPVGVVQLVEHEALDATVRGFIDELSARGFKDGEKIRIDTRTGEYMERA